MDSWKSPYWTSWTLDTLCNFIAGCGGSVHATRACSIYDHEPAHWEVIRAWGGLKKFCLAHSIRLEWVSNAGPGHEEVKLRVSQREAGRTTGQKRVARLAGGFAGALPDLFSDAFVSKEQLADAWTSFCTDAGEDPGGFGRAVYLLVRRRIVARAGWHRFQLLGKEARNFKKRAPADSEGALLGEPPPTLTCDLASPVPLYDMPGEFCRLTSQDVYSMQANVQRLLCEDKGLEPKKMTVANFRAYQHALLFTEELQMRYDISMYDLEVQEKLRFARGLHTIFVPGLAEKRPSVIRGDGVLVKCKQGCFRGYVHRVRLEAIEVSLHKSFSNKPPFTVQFSFNRLPLRCMHRAIDELDGSLVGGDAITRPRAERHPQLNAEQGLFLSVAAQPVALSCGLPLLLWGPPGTGKTTTVVHTIVSVMRKQPAAKILVTAPSNPAADLLCERLAKLGVKNSEMLRLVAVSRDLRGAPEVVLQYSRTDPVTETFEIPKLGELQRQRVVVATCTTAAYIRSSIKTVSELWFTHVFVDEAAQAMEAEVLVPLTLRKPGGHIFLAGDFKQLGPVIRSPVAIHFGLDVPLMERIVQVIGIEHSRVFPLLESYRAHPSVLRLYNKTVYGDMLKCSSPVSSYDMEAWPECPGKQGAKHPIIFHNCDGQESRSRDSPSWENVDEGTVVKTYLMKLLAYGVRPEDIGIISPYHKQCQRLRYICLAEDVDAEVGTTELFQGREKRVIIISTVRSRQQEELASDFRFTLGFLGNFKRTNVALSRARSLVVVVGNLALLSKDATWHSVIKLATTMGCVRGPKFTLSRALYGESSEWAGSRAPPVGAPATSSSARTEDRPWRDYS